MNTRRTPVAVAVLYERLALVAPGYGARDGVWGLRFGLQLERWSF